MSIRRDIMPALALRRIAASGIGRRDFLKRSCCAASAIGLASGFGRFGKLQALAQSSSGYKALVCVFLFGGNDSNNLLIPLDQKGYAQYANARGPLALPQTSLLPLGNAGPSPFGIHPALSDLPGLFTSGRLAFLVNVGSITAPTTRADFITNAAILPENLFSHLDQENQWQSGFGSSSEPTGWGGRIADIVGGAGQSFPTVISLGGETLFCVGGSSSPLCISPGGNYSFSGLSGDAEATQRAAAMQQILTFSSGATLVQAASDSIRNSFRESSALGAALASANTLNTPFPQTYIGAQLLQIARLIQVRSALGLQRQIFFALVGGFDTHTDQLPIQETLFGQLSSALAAFYSATVELGVEDSVTTFTLSDFSRTLTPNSTGTDHGWGGHHLILGGAVKGGLYGKFPALVPNGPDDSADNGRWVPTSSVDQYAATLATWFGVPEASLAMIAPNIGNFNVQNLGFV